MVPDNNAAMLPALAPAANDTTPTNDFFNHEEQKDSGRDSRRSDKRKDKKGGKKDKKGKKSSRRGSDNGDGSDADVVELELEQRSREESQQNL